MRFFSCAMLAIASLLTISAEAAELKYSGYMRAPVGTNSSGGKQIHLNNPGSQGNEFRLGNEGGYGEAYFTGQFAENKDGKSPYFDTHLAFAYNPAMNAQYGDTTPASDNIQFVEAYAKGGNFDGLLMSFWAGKRFYRDGDAHMDDFFYFADMSGNGGGIENWQMGNGSLAIALMQYADDRSLTNSTTGIPAKHALDLRYRDLAISDKDKLELWLAPGYTGPGKGISTGTGTPAVDYQASSGVAGGVKWSKKTDLGTNDFAVVYGMGVMESLNLNNTAFAANDTIKKRTRLRVVENYSAELNDNWAIQGVAAYEAADSAAANNSKSTWTSVGVRPMYYFTDHFRLQTELGYSVVKNEADTSATGSVGDRQMTRMTLAPEVAFGKGYYTRPVVRFYITHTLWNDANKDLTNPNSLVSQVVKSQSVISLNDKNNETQMGFQAEAWF